MNAGNFSGIGHVNTATRLAADLSLGNKTKRKKGSDELSFFEFLFVIIIPGLGGFLVAMGVLPLWLIGLVVFLMILMPRRNT